MSIPDPSRQTTWGAVTWYGVAQNPVALMLLPWIGGGTTVVKRDADGKLYGCRDVSLGPHHDSIVAAWADEARGKGVDVEDYRK